VSHHHFQSSETMSLVFLNSQSSACKRRRCFDQTSKLLYAKESNLNVFRQFHLCCQRLRSSIVQQRFLCRHNNWLCRSIVFFQSDFNVYTFWPKLQSTSRFDNWRLSFKQERPYLYACLCQAYDIKVLEVLNFRQTGRHFEYIRIRDVQKISSWFSRPFENHFSFNIWSQ
jgi:hypothetical protein